ncbi:asparagine synthase (glutamine-hydrolyzing) [Acinetobacter junii]|nr:asparagine synthase (glutamine-hydrolyzing) [Acinetobacter junii]ENV52137.1 asparagine synthase (glutamine-hydrolyzing) [Acinetobacter junii CIP 107470 = MTCC 11364]
MCGFVGYISQNNVENRLSSALEMIKHRGPDAHKYIVYEHQDKYIGFAHARLSIIDLSQAATQPFESKCSQYSIIFNGEIYNYREIREELKQLGFSFNTDSDTEVLLAAWQQWKHAVLTKFVGMFAFAVLDKNEHKVTLVRDAFGIKPFFYSIDNGELFFGSDIRSVISLRGKKSQPNLQKAYDYLVHGDYDSSEQSFIDGVKHLLPGHWFEYDLATGKVTNPSVWWQPDLSHTLNLSFKEAAQKTRELFLESIKYHLRSDVPLGAALSGGVDSSAVVCAMRALDSNAEIHTFSYIADDEELTEELWVDGVTDYVNATAHKVYSSGKEMQADLDHMLLMQGEPFGGTSIYAQYRVFKLAKEKGITVTLDGQGADELLAGYSGYPGYRLLSLIENGKLFAAHQFSKKWAMWPGRSYSLAWKYFARIVLPDAWYASVRKRMGRDFYPKWLNVEFLQKHKIHFSEKRVSQKKSNKGKRVREALANALQGRGLPGLLRHGDRNSMAFSIESRVPFLSLPFAEFLLSLPEEYLISNEGETKHVFREAMRGIVPDTHLDRKDKIGFATPESEWLLGMAVEIRQWIEQAPEIEFINKLEIVKEFEEVVAGKRKFDLRVWRWVNYLRWYTLVICEKGNE